MSSTCRFKPIARTSEESVEPLPMPPHTSVMNFQWIDSLTDVCNETTHDKFAPNRQNLYCNFKSVWEVIKESPDFSKINSTPNSSVPPPAVEFHFTGQSKLPLLYILLDKGIPYFDVRISFFQVQYDTEGFCKCEACFLG